ncbi:MAG TPA: sigma-70 family RNA polymerase sigma factor [Candidatus Binataceae bacterium]
MERPSVSPQLGEPQDGVLEPEVCLKELSGLEIDNLWREAEAGAVDLTQVELATVLLTLGAKYNYGLAPSVGASRAQIATFVKALQLRDLALAHACALGRNAAWERFVARFREPLRQAAIGITASASLGQELADSLYAELFGLTKRGESRRSLLATYSGRGSLMGFLRATLAQRNVDRHRRAGRETPIEDEDPPAALSPPHTTPEVLLRLGQSLTAIMGSLDPEERFLLSAWFFDGRTLLEISRTLNVHEATVSRRIQRLIARLHKDLLKNLQALGMSQAGAEEALGTDPRDLAINLRTLLQTSRPAAFLGQEPSGDSE